MLSLATPGIFSRQDLPDCTDTIYLSVWPEPAAAAASAVQSAMTSPNAMWNRAGDDLFHKRELYDYEHRWKGVPDSFAECVISIAAWGGPVAVSKRNLCGAPTIHVFSQSGVRISEFRAALKHVPTESEPGSAGEGDGFAIIAHRFFSRQAGQV